MDNLSPVSELSTDKTITNKIVSAIKGLDKEIHQYEKNLNETDEYAIFIKGNISGLRTAKTLLEILFKNQIESEVQNG